MSYLIYKVPFLDICPLYIQIHVQNAACTMIQLCWCSKNEPAVQTHWLTKNDDTESVCSAGDRVQSLRGKRREWQPTPRFLPGESYRWRSPEGYSPRVHKSRTRLSDQHFYHDMHWSIFTTMMIRNNPRL